MKASSLLAIFAGGMLFGYGLTWAGMTNGDSTSSAEMSIPSGCTESR